LQILSFAFHCAVTEDMICFVR